MLPDRADGALPFVVGCVAYVVHEQYKIALMVRVDEFADRHGDRMCPVCVATTARGGGWRQPGSWRMRRRALRSTRRRPASPRSRGRATSTPFCDPARFLLAGEAVAYPDDSESDGEGDAAEHEGVVEEYDPTAAHDTAPLRSLGPAPKKHARARGQSADRVAPARGGLRILSLGGGPASALLAFRAFGVQQRVTVVVIENNTDLGKACRIVGEKNWQGGSLGAEFHCEGWHAISSQNALKALGGTGGFAAVLATPHCEPFSAMGKREGFGSAAKRSVAYDDWVQIRQIMRWCRELWPTCALALENVPMSAAHRLEATELMADVLQCQQLLDTSRSQPTSRARLLLTSVPIPPMRALDASDPTRPTITTCLFGGAFPLHDATGKPPLVAACLVSGNVSRAFRGPVLSASDVELVRATKSWSEASPILMGPAATAAPRARARRYNYVFDPSLSRVRSLYIGECEQLLGFPLGYTDAPGVSLTMRRRIVKNAMDIGCAAHVLRALLLIA